MSYAHIPTGVLLSRWYFYIDKGVPELIFSVFIVTITRNLPPTTGTGHGSVFIS